MLSFLFLLLPLAFLLYCIDKKDKQILIPALIGLACGIILCACRAFFSFSHRVIPYSFGQNLGYIAIQDLIMPVVLCVAYYFISRDTWEYKVNCFFPLICSYFIVYLPYSVAAGTESIVYSEYQIFVKPIICLVMIYQLAVDVKLLYEGIRDKYILKIILNVLVIILYIVYPLISDTFYIMGYPLLLIIGLAVVYTICPILHFAYTVLKQ